MADGRDELGRFAPGKSGNEATMWQPGQSGNAAGWEPVHGSEKAIKRLQQVSLRQAGTLGE